MNCNYCDGFHFIRHDNGYGPITRCPVCSCDRCERLRWADPDDGGCICPKYKGKQAKKRASDCSSSNPSPKEAHSPLSVPSTLAPAKPEPVAPLIVERYEPFSYSNQQIALLTVKDRDALFLATARCIDGVVQCKLANPAVSLNEALASFDQAIRSLFPGAPLPVRSAPVPPPYQPDKLAIERQIPLYRFQQGKLLADLLLNLGVPVQWADQYRYLRARRLLVPTASLRRVCPAPGKRSQTDSRRRGQQPGRTGSTAHGPGIPLPGRPADVRQTCRTRYRLGAPSWTNNAIS
jgi:hypothetical protein